MPALEYASPIGLIDELYHVPVLDPIRIDVLVSAMLAGRTRRSELLPWKLPSLQMLQVLLNISNRRFIQCTRHAIWIELQDLKLYHARVNFNKY